MAEFVGRHNNFVENRTAVQFIPIIKDFVRPRTAITLDEWKSYKQLFRHSYLYFTVTHKYNFVDPETGAHMQIIKSNWWLAKYCNKVQSDIHCYMLDLTCMIFYGDSGITEKTYSSKSLMILLHIGLQNKGNNYSFHRFFIENVQSLLIHN